MSSRLAILAGEGALPGILARAAPEAVFVTFAGVNAIQPPEMAHLAASFERLGALFEALHGHGVTEVVFAGAMRRPALDPARFDATMLALAPRLMAAMGQGDDALLREVATIFEGQGLALRAAHEIAPALLMMPGTRIGPAPGAREEADAQRGFDILAALGPLDVGQCAVVAGGQVLGIETLQGTDAMLGFVTATPPDLRRAPGVLVKAPKPEQDRRFDLPTIGPGTVQAAARAGLAGIFIAGGGVNVLDRPATEAALADSGLFLMAR